MQIPLIIFSVVVSIAQNPPFYSVVFLVAWLLNESEAEDHAPCFERNLSFLMP